jgi:two-component system, NarL family, nitrate/nitrite response regulator NarL
MSLRVLIVDDSELFLNVACMVLEREGLSVVGVASTTSDALARAEELRPDVVLVDITLAGESGFDLARRLAEEDHGGGRSVILISTHAQEDFADLVTDCPACGFLPKSDLSADAVLKRVHSGSD